MSAIWWSLLHQQSWRRPGVGLGGVTVFFLSSFQSLLKVTDQLKDVCCNSLNTCMFSIAHIVQAEKHICLNYSPLPSQSLSQIPQLDNYTYKSQLTLTVSSCQRTGACICVPACFLRAWLCSFACERWISARVCACVCARLCVFVCLLPLCLFSKVQQRGSSDQHHLTDGGGERFPWQPGALVSGGG